MDFYYFDQFNQKQGPVSKEELKDLADRGVIEPNTPMETSSGHTGTAGQIPDLFIAKPHETPQQQHQQRESLFCSNCDSTTF